MYKVLVLDKYMGIPTCLNFSKSDLRFMYGEFYRYYGRKYKLLEIKKISWIIKRLNKWRNKKW